MGAAEKFCIFGQHSTRGPQLRISSEPSGADVGVFPASPASRKSARRAIRDALPDSRPKIDTFDGKVLVIAARSYLAPSLALRRVTKD